MTELEKIKLLVSKVEAIGLKYTGVAEREQYAFNVFSILRKSHDEVGLHSAFLKALFDPNGGHGQGTWFLNAFLDRIGLEAISDGVITNAFREYTRIRHTQDDNNTRDSVDIYVKAGKRAIIIENKIYACDQENQLCRYVRLAMDEGFEPENINVIYLTLDGHEPSADKDESQGLKLILFEDEDQPPRIQCPGGHELSVKLMSYADDVIPLLDKCIAHMATYPTTRESLVLYRRIVRQLTGKSMNEEETMEIAEHFASNKENMQMVRKILDAYSTAKAEIQFKFWESLEKALDNQLHDFTYRIMKKNDKASQKYDKDQIKRFYSGARPRPWCGIKIHLGTLDNTNIDICFMAEVEHNIYYGFIAQERDKEWTEREHLKNAAKDEISTLCKTMGYGASDWWLGWRYPQIGYPNFMNFNDKADEMADDNLRLEYVSQLAKEIIAAIQDFRNEIEDKHIAVKWGT